MSRQPLSPGERLVAAACRRRFVGGVRVGLRRPRTPKPATPDTVHPSSVAAETMTPLSSPAVVTPDRSAKSTAPPSPSTQASSSSFSYDRELLCDVRRAVLCGRQQAPSPPPLSSSNDDPPPPLPKINMPPSPSPSFVVDGEDGQGDFAAVSDGVCAWTRSSLDVLAYVVAPCKDIFDTKYCGPGTPQCDRWCYNAEEEEGSAGGSLVDYAEGMENEAFERTLSKEVESLSSYGGSLAPLVDYPGGGIGTGRLGIAPIYNKDGAYNLLDAPTYDEDETGHATEGTWATSLSRMMRQSNLLAPEGERTFVPFDTFQFLSVDMNISVDDPDGSNVTDADGIEPTMEMAAPQQWNLGAQSSVDGAPTHEEETKGKAALSANNNGNAATGQGKNLQSAKWKRERIKSIRFRRRDRLPASASTNDVPSPIMVHRIDPAPVESTASHPSRGDEDEPPAPESPCMEVPLAEADGGDDTDGRHRRKVKMAKVKRRRDMLRAAAAS